MGLADDIKKAVEGKISAEKLKQACKNALGKMSEDIVNDAKSNLRNQKAINTGALVNSIYAEPVTDNLTLNIVAGAPYASYIEFGTRKFAAEYVASLPKDWQTLASQYKGKGGGTFEELVKNIAVWVGQKGIAGRYSVKTRKRVGDTATKEKENMEAAYPIALKIVKNGIKARPYLYPAYVKNRNIFDQELSKVFK